MSAALRAFQLLPIAALLAGGWQDPQTGSAPPTLRITVTLVQVDAVVTDSAGRHVSDLTKDDFEILQDGRPRKLTWFRYMPPPPQSAKEAPPPKSAKDAVPVPLAPPAAVAAGQVQRTVALVVDDMALSFEDLVRTRDALRKYIEQQMQPGDLVALVRTGGGVAILEQFTTDKRILLEAVDLLKWRFMGRTGLGPIQRADAASGERGPEAEPEVLDYDYSMAALGALGTLEQVIRGMKQYPGRKSIVFLSSSLRIDPQLMDSLDHITDLANRSEVSLYTVDPGGLRTNSKVSADIPVYVPDRTTRRFPGLGEEHDPEDPGDELGWQAGLSYLATRTGGLFFHNTNDIPGAVRAATDDQLGYYLLGYSPAEGTFDKNPRSAKFHKVTVRVTRPGLKVRWKSGFEGVPEEATPVETVSRPATREQQLAEALASPFTATGLKVRLTSFFLDPKPIGPTVYSMLYFDAQNMKFIQEPDGAWNATVDVITLAYRGFKQDLRQTQRVQPIHLSDAAYRKALKEGFLLYVNTPIKEPGAFILRAVVRDWGSQRLGSSSAVIQIPDVRKGQFALSGLVVRLATPELLQKLGIAAPAASPNGQVEEWSEGGPAVRRFRSGQSIAYGYSILNPKLHGSPKQPQLTTQTRLYRNGKIVFTGNESHSVEPMESDATRYGAGGILRLGSMLIPGEYILQVTVTDGLASKKNARMSQWMDFEVVDTAPATARSAEHGDGR
jgi:VWFA-related protein